jgi:hypothetical protein
MDAMESMQLMEVRDFVQQGTISDVCVARFVERQMANAPKTAVLGRTEFARLGILMAAIVIINCSLMQVLCSHFSVLLTGQLRMIFRNCCGLG